MLTLRVTPKASRNAVTRDGDLLRIYVTCVPEGGKANAAVVKRLAKALGVPKPRLQLIRGASGRDKVLVVAPCRRKAIATKWGTALAAKGRSAPIHSLRRQTPSGLVAALIRSLI